MGPLKGLSVVEMVGLGPCPLAGQLLADMGAEVVVIDRRSGTNNERDINRRGKKSIALDLKQEAGVETAMRLIAAADVLMEGFRPGVMERLGLGPEECQARHPGLVYARMTGWGQEGPLAHSAGHDINYLAITGALHAMGEVGEPPRPPLNLVADYGGGTMFLVTGVLAALFERGVSGKGQVVDAAMIDGVPAMMGMIHTMLDNGMWTPNRQDNFLDGAAPYYRCYRSKDYKFISVGAIEPQFFAELVRLLELDEGLCAEQNDKSKWAEHTELFANKFFSRTRDEWAAVFEGTDACVAPVLTFAEAAKYPHNKERQVFVKRGHLVQAAPAPRFSRSHCDLPKPSGNTGEDGRTVLVDAGFSGAEIEQLASSGVLL